MAEQAERTRIGWMAGQGAFHRPAAPRADNALRGTKAFP